LRLARVYHHLDRASARHLRAFDLSVAQFDVLAQVEAHEGIRQGELARVLLVTQGNVCQLLDRLEARGLVERRPARGSRGNYLYLTEAGHRLYRCAVPAQEALIAARMAALSEVEQGQLLALLRKLDLALDNQADEDETEE
jgi:DNA-binding MarR family transcriptional regulator